MWLTYFVVILLMAILVVFVLLLRNVMQSQAKEDSSPAGELIHDNMMMQAELKEFSEEMFAKIDDRIASLQKLIKEADDRIDTLDTLELPAGQARTPRKTTERTPPPQTAEDRAAGGQPQRRTAIISLARKGFSAEQIAQEVGMGRGEVEFILNIEKQRNG